jgi:hypothetical protein
VLIAACAVLAATAAWARDAEPLTRIPLTPLGYRTMMPEPLLDGSSMLTVDFVDRDHLLITFAVHRLMRRETNDPPDDADRTVAAALVELPTGKVIAQTEWRMHDHEQYLWSLGSGRFLLRIRDSLSIVAPLQAGDAFRATPLLRSDRQIVAILLSPESDLLTVESTRHAGDVTLVDPAQPDTAPVQLNFYRLTSAGASANGLQAISAGAIRAQTPVALPMTTAGFLDLIDGGSNRWLFNFDEHAGKVDELAEFVSTCSPRETFVDRGEFVAFGCWGSQDRKTLAGFNLRGDATWQQNFSDQIVAPSFSFAPAAGRFALGRVVVDSAVDEDGTLPESLVRAQEIRVIQSYDGRQLFRIDCSPVERAGGNFSLSDDGLRLAVVREKMVYHPATPDYEAYSQREAAVEVYALPALSEKDQAAVKAAEAMAPKDVGARIDLSLERESTPVTAEAAEGRNAIGGDSPATATSTQTASDQAAPAATSTPTEGDPLPDAPRKRPTLYGPDEKPADASSRERDGQTK